MYIKSMIAGALLVAAPVTAQTNDPFPAPIPATEGAIRVNFTEFATLPDIEGVAARAMTLVTEPGTRRMFVSDMRGPLYSLSYDGRTVTEYLDINDTQWGVPVQSQGRERGVQNFAFHPQFNQAGTPGYGKFYTWLDTSNKEPAPDFTAGGGNDSHDTILLEWTARTPTAATFDGGAPRELMRFEQPFPNHNAGGLGFNPTADQGDEDFGLLYIGVGDGGSGGDPLDVSQNMANGFGKIFRIDPMGRNSPNGKYGIPASNPFVADNNPQTLGEIYVSGVRNPQRFSWDPENGNMYLADIGQGIVEELDLVTKGANLGWRVWEGSYLFGSQTVSTDSVRGDRAMTYPIVEYAQADPLLMTQSAITGVHVYRGSAIPALSDRIIFGDIPSGEIFYIPADNLPSGGQDAIRRIVFNDNGTAKTLLELIQAKNSQQGKTPATRADMRMGSGPDGQLLIINKADGVIRLIVP